jgi:GTP-binding protein
MPDSGDYFEFVKEELLAEGIAPDHIFPLSAVTGQGVLDLVKKVRKVLDELGPAQQMYETNAVNQTRLPGRQNERLDDFTIDVEEPKGPTGPKVFYVMGKALQKFAQVSIRFVTGRNSKQKQLF